MVGATRARVQPPPSARAGTGPNPHNPDPEKGRMMRRLKRLNAWLNDSLIGDAIGCVCLFGTAWMVLVTLWVLQ